MNAATGSIAGMLSCVRRVKGRPAFFPFITAGDPTLAHTARLISALEKAGADAIELGVPFSDPVADGPVIERASQRALRSKTTLSKILDMVSDLRARGARVPLILFTYYNPILQMGIKTFAARAKRAGAQAVLAVDLPPEEAQVYRKDLAAARIETIFLASPTTTGERLRMIDEASTAFVYYVSRLGVTGESQRLPAGLPGEMRRLRRYARKPVAIGFGISTPEQAGEAACYGDAVVVGSALVKLTEGRSPAQALRLMQALASAMMDAMRQRSGSC